MSGTQLSGRDVLIEPVELQQLLASSTPALLLDVRWKLGDTDGRRRYGAAHIPSAVYVDLDSDLAAPASELNGRHPIPQLKDFEVAARRWGVNDGQTVVVYDDNCGLSAARAWWLMRWAGVEDARILNAYINFASENPALYDAMFTRATRLPFGAGDRPAPLSAAFAELRETVTPVARGRDVDTLTEVTWAALHGLVTLARNNRLRPGLDSDRVQILVAELSNAVPAKSAPN